VAVAARRLPENVPGTFYVDDSCIDCAKCREVAPATFADTDRGASFVFAQPGDAAARHRALMALVACPTASIGTAPRLDARAATDAFPEPIAPGVYDCGFTAEASFGASSYLLGRAFGNVLVDSPRAAAPLLRAIGRLGGVRWLFLTHGDDVADHRRLADAFACTRILHEGDIGPGTASVEHVLRGRDPVDLAPGLTIVPVPGHTRGSAALLADEMFLFTGDHLWGAADGQGLSASRSVCWYSWSEQRRSLQRLLDLRFEWVLPGHGRRFRASSALAMRAALERLLRALPKA
jgi:glyoxylase-like metal-dependent hydrolase (beta-lactamase superfamily II)/ferredoxin